MAAGTLPRLSPDRRSFVAGTVTSRNALRIFSADGALVRELPTGGLLERRAAMWLPDGRRVLYSGLDAGGASRLFVQDVAGGAPRAFGPVGATFDGTETGKLVAPDGARVAARDRDRRWGAIAIEDGSFAPIPGVAATESIRQWASDGRGVYVVGPSGATAPIDLVELATGKRTPFAVAGSHRPAFRGGVGEVFVTPSGTTWVYSSVTSQVDVYLVDRAAPVN